MGMDETTKKLVEELRSVLLAPDIFSGEWSVRQPGEHDDLSLGPVSDALEGWFAERWLRMLALANPRKGIGLFMENILELWKQTSDAGPAMRVIERYLEQIKDLEVRQLRDATKIMEMTQTNKDLADAVRDIWREREDLRGAIVKTYKAGRSEEGNRLYSNPVHDALDEAMELCEQIHRPTPKEVLS